jgi:threonine/homoserine/homoserine lactone efflux protein
MYLQDLNQFLAVALAHLLAVISPGPDFILITRQSFLYGRKTSIYTALGIASGILIHVTYCIIGLNFLLNNDNIVFYLKLLSSLYLTYLGIVSIFSKNFTPINNIDENAKILKISPIVAYRDGFITNILNIKATFFFMSLYLYINTDVLTIRLLYGLWMSIITGLWFILLSIMLTNSIIKENTYNYQFYINKLMGIVLLYIAIKIYFN